MPLAQGTGKNLYTAFHNPTTPFLLLLLPVAKSYTHMTLCQLVGAKNAVTFLHMFKFFSLCGSADTYLMLGILSVLSHVMFSAIL